MGDQPDQVNASGFPALLKIDASAFPTYIQLFPDCFQFEKKRIRRLMLRKQFRDLTDHRLVAFLEIVHTRKDSPAEFCALEKVEPEAFTSGSSWNMRKTG